MINNLIIPIIISIIIIYGIYKKTNIYDEFIKGAKESIEICIKLFPTMLAMILATNLFIKSGFLNQIFIIIEKFVKIKYKELIPLIITRSISGSSSIGILNNILASYGPDSKIGIIASIMQGTTETTIYILTIYFASVGIKKSKHALVIGLLADLISALLSIFIIDLLFK
jgi:spore maturation protein B